MAGELELLYGKWLAVTTQSYPEDVQQRPPFGEAQRLCLVGERIKGVHFHDLRHAGDTLAATGGASTRELMQRMGHSTVRAAMVYQRLVGGRDQEIADHMDRQIKKSRKATKPKSAKRAGGNGSGDGRNGKIK